MNRVFILVPILLCFFATGSPAQRMDMKKHLGFDFSYTIDEVIDYYTSLGSAVVRDYRDSCDTERAECLIRFVALTGTPNFLNAPTRYLQLGSYRNALTHVAVVVEPGTNAERVESRLARSAIEIDLHDGGDAIPFLQWTYNDCRVRRYEVLLDGDTALYNKYDILQPDR